MKALSVGTREDEVVSARRIRDLEGCQSGLMQPRLGGRGEARDREAPYNPRLARDEGTLEKTG